MGARFYDPALRRFYAPDPAGQFTSPYAYAGNCPLVLIDPNGAFSWAAFLIGIGLAIVGIAAIVATAGIATPVVVGSITLEASTATAIGSIAGGTVLGAGISGASYGLTHNGFDGRAFGTALGIGAATGFVASAAAVGLAAGTNAVLAQVFARLGTDFGENALLDSAGGAVRGAIVGTGSSTASQATGNAIEHQPIGADLGTAAWIGALSGGLLEGLGSGFASRETIAAPLRQSRFQSDLDEVLATFTGAGNPSLDYSDVFTRPRARNFAVMRYQTGGTFYRWERTMAFSGTNNPPFAHPELQGIPMPGGGRAFQTLFDNRPVPVDRFSDSEAKLFEHKNQAFVGQNPGGRMFLTSSRDFCTSCRHVSDQFDTAYPQISYHARHYIPYNWTNGTLFNVPYL